MTNIRRRFAVSSVICEPSQSPLSITNWSLIAAISTEPYSNEDILNILENRHDSVTAGHPGIHKTYKSIAKDFYWPNMLQDIKEYVNSCIVCQTMKTSRISRKFPILPIEAPKRPWSMISVDFIVKLPISQGFDSIFVVIDHFTKMAHFLPCKESITAKETAVMFIKNIFKLHGFPEKIISDRGPQFISKFWSAVFESAGAKVKLTSAFHPQANGQTERTNQSLEQYLRCFINHEQNNWVDLLNYAEFAFNNSESSSIGMTPFYANYGFHPRSDFIVDVNASSTTTSENLQEIHGRLYQNLLKSKEKMTRLSESANKLQFEVGDLVLLRTTNMSSSRPCPKLDLKQKGPFRIIEKLSPVSYKLQLPIELNIYPVFHINLLQRFIPRAGQAVDLPNDQLRYENEYLVDKILDSRINSDNEIQYLVQWKDFPPEEDTWEPLANLNNCLAAVRKFHEKNSEKPCPPRNLLFKRRMMLRN